MAKVGPIKHKDPMGFQILYFTVFVHAESKYTSQKFVALTVQNKKIRSDRFKLFSIFKNDI
jgi:hypothetical protein